MKTIHLALLGLLVAVGIHAGDFAHLGPYESTYASVYGTYLRSAESYKKEQKASYIEYALKQIDAEIACYSTPEEKRKPKNAEFLDALRKLRTSCQSMLGVVEMSPHLTKRLEFYGTLKHDSNLVSQITKDLATPAVQALEGFAAFRTKAEALAASIPSRPDSVAPPSRTSTDPVVVASPPVATDMDDSLKRRLAKYRAGLDKLVQEQQKPPANLGGNPRSAWQFLASDIEDSLSNSTVLGPPSRRTPGHEAYLRDAGALLAELKRLETEIMATDTKYIDIQERLRRAVGAPTDRATALSAIRKDAAELPESERREDLLRRIDTDLASAKTAMGDAIQEEAARKKRLAEDGARHREIVKQYGSASPKVFGVDLKKCILDPASYKGTPVRLSLVRIHPISGVCHITPLTKDAMLDASYEDASELGVRLSKAWELQGDFDTVTITIVYDGTQWWVLDLKL